MITGAIVLAAVTSMPNAVAAVFLARRGRASATLSEAFNSNTLNVLAGLLIPAVIIASPSLGGALQVAVWYQRPHRRHHRPGPRHHDRSADSRALIIAAFLVFAITVIVKAIPPPPSSPALPSSEATRCRSVPTAQMQSCGHGCATAGAARRGVGDGWLSWLPSDASSPHHCEVSTKFRRPRTVTAAPQ